MTIYNYAESRQCKEKSAGYKTGVDEGKQCLLPSSTTSSVVIIVNVKMGSDIHMRW